MQRIGSGCIPPTDRDVLVRFIALVASGWGAYAAAEEFGLNASHMRKSIRRAGLILSYSVALDAQKVALRSGADPRSRCACGGRKLIGHQACRSCRGRENVKHLDPQRRPKRAIGYAVRNLACCGEPPHRRCEPNTHDDPNQEFSDYCGALIGPEHVARRQDAAGRCEKCQTELLRIRRKRALQAGAA